MSSHFVGSAIRPVLLIISALAMMAAVPVTTPHAHGTAGCGPGGGPSPGAASQDVSAVYGEPATLWISSSVIGIATAHGYSQAAIESPSPLQRSALIIDAQQDGNHQVIVDTGREAILYVVSGCTISPAVDQRGQSFRFDVGHRRDAGDGVGCSDLGDGRRLVGLLQQRDDLDQPLLAVRRTEIDLDGPVATPGRSDVVTATSKQDPAWTTAADISCGDRTLEQDGVKAPY
jgi:hypothetical protein